MWCLYDGFGGTEHLVLSFLNGVQPGLVHEIEIPLLIMWNAVSKSSFIAVTKFIVHCGMHSRTSKHKNTTTGDVNHVAVFIISLDDIFVLFLEIFCFETNLLEKTLQADFRWMFQFTLAGCFT